MFARIGTIVVAALFIFGGHSAAFAEKRVAFVVGNGAYLNAPKLPNPPNDAADVARAFRNMGFEVVDAIDTDKNHFSEKVSEFSDMLRGADVAVFFYAGHGVQIDGRNYLIPIDAKLERATDVKFRAIDMGTVIEEMEANAKANIVFLDACRDNPFVDTISRSARGGVSRGLASMTANSGTYIAFATQPGLTAADGDERNSPFTTALLKHLPQAGVELRSLMQDVRNDVERTTNNKQKPRFDDNLSANVFLVAKAADDVVANNGTTNNSTGANTGGDDLALNDPNRRNVGVPNQFEQSAEFIFWQSVERAGTKEFYELYLRRYGDKGQFAEIAKQMIAALSPKEGGNTETAGRTDGNASSGGDSAGTAREAFIKLGLSEPELKRIYNALVQLSFAESLGTRRLDFITDSRTIESVRRFQEARGFDATGFLSREQAMYLASLGSADDVTAGGSSPEQDETKWAYGGYNETLIVGRFAAAFRYAFNRDPSSLDALNDTVRNDIRDLQSRWGLPSTGYLGPDFLTRMLNEPANYMIPNWYTHATSGDWKFYKYDDGSCMIWTYATEVQGKFVSGYVPYLSIRRNKDFKGNNLSFNYVTVESIDATTYPLDTARPISLSADGRRYNLAFHSGGTQVFLSEDNQGFADSSSVKAVARARDYVTVEGTAKLGGRFSATYSARGFGDMFRKMDRECANNGLSGSWLK